MSRHAEAHLVVEPKPKNVRVARQFLRTALEEWGRSHLADTAVLLASELLTNVILHAGTSGEICVERWDDRVRVEVRDADALLPTSRHYSSLDGTTGRGLMLVSALSADWGVEPEGPGKVVWFELDDTDPGEGARTDIVTADGTRGAGQGPATSARKWREWSGPGANRSVSLPWPPGQADVEATGPRLLVSAGWVTR